MVVEASTRALIQRTSAAFNAGDADAMIEICHPEVEWIPLRAALEGTEYRGHDGVRRFFADLSEDWSSARVEPHEYLAVDERVAVALGKLWLRGRSSGAEVELEAAWTLEVEDGLLRHLRMWPDRDEALRAHGLA